MFPGDTVEDAAQVQVPRHVGLVQHEGVLEAAAQLQGRRRRALPAVRGRVARQVRGEEAEEAEARQSGAEEAQQDGPGVPERFAGLLREERNVSTWTKPWVHLDTCSSSKLRSVVG